MTRERAIQLAKKWSKGLACSLREGEAEEYHEMFLEMLCDESRPRKLMRHGEWRLFDEAPFAARIKRAQRKKSQKEEREIK